MLYEYEIWCGLAAFGNSETGKGNMTQRSTIKQPGCTFRTDAVPRYILSTNMSV